MYKGEICTVRHRVRLAWAECKVEREQSMVSPALGPIRVQRQDKDMGKCRVRWKKGTGRRKRRI